MENVEDQPARPPHDRQRLRLALAAIVAITVMSWIGDIAAAGLVERHPLWLIALNTRKRWLAAVVPHTDVLPYFVVGVLRQLLSDPIYYLLGRWYGDAGARWIEKKMGEGGVVIRWLESGFAKASWPMVAIFPNHIICMLAGASRMPARLFYVLNVGGTIVTMAILRAFGNVFESPITKVTGFLNRYRWPIIAFSFVIVAVNIVQQRRTGKVETVDEMERRLEAEAAAEAPVADAPVADAPVADTDGPPNG